MAKSIKLKAVKSLKRSRMAESSYTKSKKPGRAHRKTAATLASEAPQSEASNNEPDKRTTTTTTTTTTLKIPAHVVWDKYPEHMEHLLDYLNAHLDVAMKLFSNSTQVAAKSEGRTKLTAKLNKVGTYLQVVDGIFSVDNDAAVQADFATNPSKYAKAIDNYIINT